MASRPPEFIRRSPDQINDRRTMTVTKDLGNDTARANYGDVTVKIGYGNGARHWSTPRGREIDDVTGRRDYNGFDYRSQPLQQQQQRHQAAIYQTTPRTVVMKGPHLDHASVVSNRTAASSASVRFGQVYLADDGQNTGIGSHRDARQRSGGNGDVDVGNGTWRTARVTLQRDARLVANVSRGELGQYSASTSPGVTSGSLLMQAESEMDKYLTEERQGDSHEALMHINKAIYIYHQILTTANEHAATAVQHQDQVRLRIMYNGAMLKLRRLVQQMTTSSPSDVTNSAHSNRHVAHHQPTVVIRTIDPTTRDPRSPSRLVNNSITVYTDTSPTQITTNGARRPVAVDTVVNGNDEYRSVQTYATLPRKSTTTRRTRDGHPQVSHFEKRRGRSADRRTAEPEPVMSAALSPPISRQHVGSLPRPLNNRLPIGNYGNQIYARRDVTVDGARRLADY